MKQRTSLVLLLCTLASLLVVAASAASQTTTGSTRDAGALDSINIEDLMRHIRALSSDEFEGRAPGSRGEQLTVDYLTEQFRRLGLKPGNPDGTYVQKVPLVGMTATSTASFEAGGKRLELRPLEDYVAVSRRFVPETRVENSELVFVGYGVVAPEYGWDDYKGLDVRGKTIVMLINDPAVADPRDPSRLDERAFKGKAMTYYGRWTYKYEIASEKGAAAAIIIHETGPAGYPFDVVKSSWGRENFDIQTPDRNMSRVGVESWITWDKARELFAASGKDLDALKRQATTKSFRPVSLGARANFTVRNTLRNVDSNNVVARIEGSDPRVRDEHVVFTAHWDHLGRDERREGDQIFNGAIDNASGTALLLELAEAFTRLPTPPRRSILFLAVTAEEKGLLGSKYYATNPLYPLTKTLGNINMDGVNQWGRTRDIALLGGGLSTLDDIATQVAREQGRTVKPDPEPEKGLYYRSDHFEFARQGVPGLYTKTGVEYVGKPADFSQRKRDEYTNRDYHNVTDEIKPDWDLAGAVEDGRLLFTVGRRVADADTFPQWKPGTEFKARRDAMMKSIVRPARTSRRNRK
jgi:Zn-dependent M28 family amino/carboxypeptidase